MACSCQKNRQQWEVVTAEGKVVFPTGNQTANKATVDTVAKRYPGSKVREKAKPGAK
ncbi:hypothetical protein OHA04_45720 (plasmid) [Streptomyces sp. NBC_01590]|uniref:hypothetical protein n=1 Tax=Streptomyces sp. NBC_01590 TaxID=2975887 RepID=UPI002F90C96C